MHKKKPSLAPQYISDTAWYYENTDSITVVVEDRHNGVYHGTTLTKIPASRLRQSLQRIPGGVKKKLTLKPGVSKTKKSSRHTQSGAR